MGCVQTRPSLNSPPRGLDKMKMDHDYVAGEHVVKRQLPKHAADRAPARRSTAAAAATREDKRGDGRALTRDGERKGNGALQRLPNPAPLLPRPMVGADADEMVGGWPRWLVNNIPKEVLAGLVPKSADSYDKLDKVGQGTYSNVYKARDRDTGKIVALKKVRFDTSESESIKFMAREIMILQKLDHPNVIKLEGLATSRMQYSLYLVFDFMPSDLARVISRPDGRLTEPQVKCYMHQLLSGLQHCHERGILHRDIKGSNLLIDRNGMLKIADFGLANHFDPMQKRPLTSRVVTLWYRAPELLLGTTDYGVGIDLWSAGCLLAEMFAGRPIMPGRNEVEQLHRIFKLCGSPSEDYWRKLKLYTSFRPQQPYKPSIAETFRDFPTSSLGLLTTLLALDPTYRGSAASALDNEFFTTSPLACDLSGLPVIYNEENDEPTQPRERRKPSKLKHRPRARREGQQKMEQSMAKSTGNSGSSKEEEKPAELASRTESIYSALKLKTYGLSSSMSPSPLAPQFQDQSRRTEGHPAATKNIKNLPPLHSEIEAAGSDQDVRKLNRYGMDKRSVSSFQFKFPQVVGVAEV